MPLERGESSALLSLLAHYSVLRTRVLGTFLCPTCCSSACPTTVRAHCSLFRFSFLMVGQLVSTSLPLGAMLPCPPWQGSPCAPAVLLSCGDRLPVVSSVWTALVKLPPQLSEYTSYVLALGLWTTFSSVWVCGLSFCISIETIREGNYPSSPLPCKRKMSTSLKVPRRNFHY